MNTENEPCEDSSLAASLCDAFADLPDPRRSNRSHPLINIVVIALVAVIAGANDYTEFEQYGLAKRPWFSTFLDLSHGIPSHDTFGRLFAVLDPTRWQACFLDWVRFTLRGRLEGGDLIALDGKCLRGSRDAEGRAVYLVNAWSTRLGLCLAQARVDAKSNEITALPDLIETLSLLNLSGCTVTVDAMGAQREVARLLTEKNASYLLALKENQPKLTQDVTWLLQDALERDFEGVVHDFCETVDCGHGREEHRQCWVVSDLSYLEGEGHHWPGLKAVAMVSSKRTVGGETSAETRYYLSSLTGGARETLSGVRAHWGVENGLHWVLDVVFGEDGHRARAGNAAANLGVLRQLALNLLKRTEGPRKGMSLKNKRKRAGWDDGFREKVLAQL